MLEGSPAERAGLRCGDEIVAVDGAPYSPIAAFRGKMGATVELTIRRLAERVWSAFQKDPRVARTVVLKLKTADFKILTRSLTPPSPPSSCDELTNIALMLRERVLLGPEQRFRLVGVGLSGFQQIEEDVPPAQLRLFD